METSKVPSFLRLIVFHNPFYLISTGLFVYGLKLLFRPDSSDMLFQAGSVGYIQPWHLMLSLSAVTLLMAVTAVGVIRYGKVWEDARSLMLIVLLMFLAISVSFDEIVTLVSQHGEQMASPVILCGLQAVFLLAVSELMLRGMQLRLSWLYRGPLYAFLLLMLAYPLLLIPGESGATNGEARWIIASFPAVAGLLTLLLLPAVRKGSGLCRNNGTPWSWPWFPWTAFGFVAFAVCFRAYSLTISFDAPHMQAQFWDTSFGLYFLVPFALAVLILLLEIGIVEQSRKLISMTLLAAPVLLLISYPWLVPWMKLNSYAAFAYDVTSTIGSPVFLTMIGLVLFYGWAWLRGVEHGETGLTAMLLLAVFVGPRFAGQQTWSLARTDIHLWPLLLLGTILVMVGVRRKSSRETFVGLICYSLAAGVLTRHVPALVGFRAMTTYHLILVSLFVVAAIFRDTLAARLRMIGAPVLTLSAVAAVMSAAQGSTVWWIAMAYAWALTAFAWAYGQLLKESLYTLVAVIHVGLAICGGLAWGTYAFFQAPMPRGLRHVILAAVSFAVAVLISVLKGGRWKSSSVDAG